MRFNDSEMNDKDNSPNFPTVDEDGFRIVGLYGPLTDKKGADIVFSMMGLRHTGEREEYKFTDEQKAALEKAQKEKDDDFTIARTEIETEIIYDPFEFMICTPGGSAAEMLAVYDVMRSIRDKMEIHTIGVGRVLSAGVPLLAAGTKGKRKIGANCRVMIHSVLGGYFGNLHDIVNEAAEMSFTQEQYIKILSNESNMSPKQIKALLKTGTNNYFSAERAVELGIADIIV